MEITFSESYELPDLAARWTELESRAAGGFFLSWCWIGTWLRTTGVRPLLVTVAEEKTIIALGLLTPVRRRRHFISVDQLCLHETGLAEFDALMIEHNNFLIARLAPPGLILEIMRALRSSNIAWDEIVLGGVPPGVVSAAETAGLRIETDRSSPNYGVDLSATPGGWENSLSANQRAQLRQSRAFAERLGPLRLKQAVDTPQALEFFDRMVSLHMVYWRHRNKPGAFATAFSQAFHRELISSQTGQARAELFELTAGNQVMGYMYNFQYADRMYNYQSGFSYADDNRHRPGLVAHAMAIELARERGLRVYDFLAGDAHYKARLGHLMGTMLWCRGQKDRPALKIERAARRLYRRVKGACRGLVRQARFS
jgi:CelD/BcsL family acetyltransferase involved in cellulose biosynthesis